MCQSFIARCFADKESFHMQGVISLFVIFVTFVKRPLIHHTRICVLLLGSIVTSMGGAVA